MYQGWGAITTPITGYDRLSTTCETLLSQERKEDPGEEGGELPDDVEPLLELLVVEHAGLVAELADEPALKHHGVALADRGEVGAALYRGHLLEHGRQTQELEEIREL